MMGSDIQPLVRRLITVSMSVGFWLSAGVLADAPPSSSPRPAEQVYNIVCGYCHGRNVGPIILGKQLPEDYIRAMVRSGPNGMPAFRPTEISPDELTALARWISVSEAVQAEYGK